MTSKILEVPSKDTSAVARGRQSQAPSKVKQLVENADLSQTDEESVTESTDGSDLDKISLEEEQLAKHVGCANWCVAKSSSLPCKC